jgi:hypothetical protein
VVTDGKERRQIRKRKVRETEKTAKNKDTCRTLLQGRKLNIIESLPGPCSIYIGIQHHPPHESLSSKTSAILDRGGVWESKS